jgi:hypothetical protein
LTAANRRIIGAALGSIMATIMIHHMKNMRTAVPTVQAMGCMASMAMFITSDMDPPSVSMADSSPAKSPAMSEDSPRPAGVDLRVISSALISMPAPSRI